jgi:hypothetical protein
LQTVINGQAAAATNANQQRLSIKDPGILAKRTANEFRYAALKSMATGEPLNVSKVGNKVEKKSLGFKSRLKKVLKWLDTLVFLHHNLNLLCLQLQHLFLV